MVDLHEVHRAASIEELEADGDLFALVEPLRHLLATVAAQEPGSWRIDAACRGLPTEWWFPTKGDPTARAQEVCARCPVHHECAEHAVATTGLTGIWGGTSERQRMTERRRRRGGGAPQ